MFLDIIHCFVYLKCRPVSLSKHNVLETGFCLRLLKTEIKTKMIDDVQKRNILTVNSKLLVTIQLVFCLLLKHQLFRYLIFGNMFRTMLGIIM
jgi:hypothetical protein